MNGQDFLRIAQEAFEPFLKDFGFIINAPSISGRYYRISFTAPLCVIWISYEPGDEALFVMIFSCTNGQLSDIDNRSETPRLADLNSRYMGMVTHKEYKENEKVFATIEIHGKEEQRLVKAAKELRLVLPKHLLAISLFETATSTDHKSPPSTLEDSDKRG